MRWLCWAICLLSIPLTGCISRIHYPASEATFELQAQPISLFEYSPSSSSLQLTENQGKYKKYRILNFSLPSSFENGQPGNRFTGQYFYNKTRKNNPLVIVLPVWGVSEYPSEKMTKALLKRGDGKLNVLRLNGLNRLVNWKQIESAQNYDEFLSQVEDARKRVRHLIIDVRRMIDWAQTRTEIDAERIGLVGFSINAIMGTLVHQTDPRIKASVLIMGGTGLGKIVSECPGNEKQTRDAVLDRLNLSQERFEESVTRILKDVDPASYPMRVNPSTSLIFDAAKDECIPSTGRENWWLTLGRPERVTLKYDHRRAFYAMTPLGFNYIRAKTYDFLEQHLLE